MKPEVGMLVVLHEYFRHLGIFERDMVLEQPLMITKINKDKRHNGTLNLIRLSDHKTFNNVVHDDIFPYKERNKK